jgi:hypothetical protein
MAVFQKKHTAIAAAASVANSSTLSGQMGLPPRVNSKLRLSLSASGDLVTCRFIVGTELLMNNAEVNASARYPLFPDDMAVDWTGIYAGEVPILEFTNGSAAARDIYWKLEVLPYGG